MTPTLSHKTSELIIYVVSKLKSQPNYDSALLGNSLFLIDYMSYNRTGKPISDLIYIKKKEGIIPKDFIQIEDSLRNEKKATVDSHAFGNEELELIEEVLKNISEKSSEISNYTKSLLGWIFAEYNEEVPFYTFHYSKNGIS
jgi:hypothetical protein